MTEPQNADGTPHLTYYDQEHLLSFVWDGNSDHIDVSHGGYGEPVVDTILVPTPLRSVTNIGVLLTTYEVVCQHYVHTQGARYETA